MLIKYPSIKAFEQQIDLYFSQFKHLQTDLKNTSSSHVNIKQHNEVPTYCGLIIHLGFTSRAEFETYEVTGRFAQAARKAKLRIEAEYEKKLHQSPATGAIFALKHLGWGNDEAVSFNSTQVSSLKIEIHHTDNLPAVTENEVDI